MFIGDADGKAKKIDGAFIGSADGKAVEIQKAYMGDANGKARLVYQRGVHLGSMAIGATVNIPVGGVSYDWIVVQHGKPSTMYDNSFNDGTTLLLDDGYALQAWGPANKNSYADSTAHSYLNNTFLNLLDGAVRNVIKQVKIPYRAGNGGSKIITSGASGLSANVFLLAAEEVDARGTYAPVDGAIMDYFKTNGQTRRTLAEKQWWLRTPDVENVSLYPGFACYIQNRDGDFANTEVITPRYFRPAIVLPSSMTI